MAPFVFLLVALAAYRASRFVVQDSLLDEARRKIYRRFPPDAVWVQAFQSEHGRTRPHKLGQLIDCPYCIGFWISGLVLWHADALGYVPATTATLDGVATFIALWWAVAGAQALLNAADGRMNR